MDTMKDRHVTLMGFVEPNLSISPKRRRQYQRIMRQRFNHCHFTTSESNLTLPTDYKPGGTFTAATGDWTTRINGRGSDPRGLGRWSYIKLQSKKKRLIIITLYRPHPTKGTKTVWTQQYLLLRIEGKTAPDPIKVLYHDLDEQLALWRQDNCEIILMMDANEIPGTKPDDLGYTLAKHGLIYLHRKRHGYDNEPTTYARGNRRIDYIYGTTLVDIHTNRAGCTPFGDGYFLSDHRGLFIDINLRAILQDDVSPIALQPKRFIHSTNPRERNQFLKLYYTHLEKNNIFQRIQNANPSGFNAQDLMIELNKIDKTRSEGMLAAAKKVGKQHAHDFSPKLKKLKRLAHLWRQLLSMIKTSIDPSKTLDQINMVDNTADLRVCPSERDCNRKLRKAQKYLKEAIPKHTRLRREFLSERRSELSEEPKDAKK